MFISIFSYFTFPDNKKYQKKLVTNFCTNNEIYAFSKISKNNNIKTDYIDVIHNLDIPVKQKTSINKLITLTFSYYYAYVQTCN